MNIGPVSRGQLVKMLRTLEANGILVSHLTYFFFYLNTEATGMQNGDDTSQSIILAARGLLVNA